MNTATPDSPYSDRVRAMYARTLPEPSLFWRNVKRIEFHVTARSPFMQAVRALRAAYPVTPICVMQMRLPNGDYLIQVTCQQLEQIIRAAHVRKAD